MDVDAVQHRVFYEGMIKPLKRQPLAGKGRKGKMMFHYPLRYRKKGFEDEEVIPKNVHLAGPSLLFQHSNQPSHVSDGKAIATDESLVPFDVEVCKHPPDIPQPVLEFPGKVIEAQAGKPGMVNHVKKED